VKEEDPGAIHTSASPVGCFLHWFNPCCHSPSQKPTAGAGIVTF
jgi:hypothetical protein